MKLSKPEVWQRGPVEQVPDLLQPVAHALLQAREELQNLMMDFPEQLLWIRPAGLASAGFHLQHLSGVLDRLFTYAKGEALTSAQREDLAAEKKDIHSDIDVPILVERFNKQVDQALLQLKETQPDTLTDFRGVGAMQLPSTVMGLLFHAAEHTMRHFGQLYVTVKFVKDQGR